MKERYSEKDISHIKERIFFWDANALIYIYWPTSSSWEKPYSSIYSNILKNGCKSCIDFIVLSEVVNRALRMEYDKHLCINSRNMSDLPFKRYRNSCEGKSALTDIYNVIRNMLLKFNVVGKSFQKVDVERMLIVDTLDFSDKGIESLCRENSYVLVTNDRDFAQSEVDILSANPSLLKYSANE